MTTNKKSFLQNWNLDKTLSLMAFLISLGTFFLLYYQTNLTRKQQYASVLPYLELFNRNPQEHTYSFCIANNGIGPAFIKKVEVHYQDSVFKTDPANFLYSQIYPQDTTISFIHTNLAEGTLLPAGAVLELLVVKEDLKSAVQLRQLFGFGKAELVVVFASVYDEEWVVRSSTFPKKLK